MYDEIGAPLRFWFAVCFGFAATASAVAISLKLQLLVHTVRGRHKLAQFDLDGVDVFKCSKTNAVKQRLAEVRYQIRAIYCFVLLTVFEDIPLGSLNLAYLRLILLNPTNVKTQSTTGATLTIAALASTFLVIGYNFKHILSLSDLWLHQQNLEGLCRLHSAAVVEKTRIVYERHSLARAVRHWHAVISFQVPPRFHQSIDNAIDIATIEANVAIEIATIDAASFASDVDATIDANVAIEIATIDAASVASDVDATIDTVRDLSGDVPMWGCLPIDPVATYPTATRDVACNDVLPEDPIRSGAAALIQAPSEVPVRRPWLSVAWDRALGRALVSIEQRHEIPATDSSLTRETKPQQSTANRTPSWLALQWDKATNQAVVSISVDDAELDSKSVDGLLRRRRNSSAGRIRTIPDNEAPANHKVKSPAVQSDLASSPKTLLDNDMPESHEVKSAETLDDSGASAKTLSAIYLKHHGKNTLAARRAAALHGADADVRLCAPHRVHIRSEERELRELMSIGHGLGKPAGLSSPDPSTDGTDNTAGQWQWQSSPKHRHRQLAHQVELAGESALERAEELVQSAERRAETALQRILQLLQPKSHELSADCADSGSSVHEIAVQAQAARRPSVDNVGRLRRLSLAFTSAGDTAESAGDTSEAAVAARRAARVRVGRFRFLSSFDLTKPGGLAAPGTEQEPQSPYDSSAQHKDAQGDVCEVAVRQEFSWV
jgi:hypothetical protein